MRSSVSFTLVASAFVSLLFFVFILCLRWIYPQTDTETIATMNLLTLWFVLLPFVRIPNTVAGQSLRALGESKFVLFTHFWTLWLVALPVCALLVWLEVSVFWVFAILVFEELLKSYPFFSRLKKRLAN